MTLVEGSRLSQGKSIWGKFNGNLSVTYAEKRFLSKSLGSLPGQNRFTPKGLPREQNLDRALYFSHTPCRPREYFCIFVLADTGRVGMHLNFFISRIFFGRFFHFFFRLGERFFQIFRCFRQINRHISTKSSLRESEPREWTRTEVQLTISAGIPRFCLGTLSGLRPSTCPSSEPRNSRSDRQKP